jgi:hypothetical protein
MCVKDGNEALVLKWRANKPITRDKPNVGIIADGKNTRLKPNRARAPLAKEA